MSGLPPLNAATTLPPGTWSLFVGLFSSSVKATTWEVSRPMIPILRSAARNPGAKAMAQSRARERMRARIAQTAALASLEFEEILQDLAAVLRQDALGMKLHAPDWQLLMAHAHDLTLVRLGGNLEALG